MSCEVHELDPFDAAAFEAWHRAYLRAQATLGDAATPWQLEELRALLQHGGTASWAGGWSAVRDGATVGAGFLRTPLLDNRELAEVDVHVDPDHQRSGIGTVLLAHLEDQARRRGRTVLTGLVGWRWEHGPLGDGAAGPAFARAHHFDLALSEVQRELRLPVEEAVLTRLGEQAAPAHAAYTLRSWTGPVPDELVEGWARLTSTLVTEAPTGDLVVEQESSSVAAVREREAVLARQGRTKHNTVALSATGEVVAYSDLATTVHEPDRAYQWGTLVRPDHRGHRLGVAVKVANLRLLQRAQPEVVRLTTYNAEVNAHMIAVNEALGFRPVARLGDFQKRLGAAAAVPAEH